MIEFQVVFFLFGVGEEGVCLIRLIFLAVKLLTGFEAFNSPVKDFTHGVSVIISDGVSNVQM